nr:metalloregulator ArsR/SmtB family transcription factor [Pseudomonas sp.]
MSINAANDEVAPVEHLAPAAVFKCLADETRARMTLLITREGELCVCELTAALEQSQPKISRHLSQLRSCSILEDRRRGQWVYYRLHPQLPAWVHDMLRLVAGANDHWLSADAERLERMRVRPGRLPACD